MKLEILTLAVLALVALGFLYVSSQGGHEWGGSDGEAENVIAQITGDSYQPWMEPFWEPPSGEIESLFFSLQAAIGGLVIGYFLGYYRRGAASR